jgi:hypothetical protein
MRGPGGRRGAAAPTLQSAGTRAFVTAQTLSRRDRAPLRQFPGEEPDLAQPGRPRGVGARGNRR